MTRSTEILAALQTRWDAESSEFRGVTRVVLPAEAVRPAMQLLRDDFEFDLLVDITCVDYLEYRGARDRFGLAYLLSSVTHNDRLTVRVMLNEPDLTVASVTPLWPGANWLEREVYDMFGIRFEGHPDLRRLLLPEEFTAHPLRKDYPLQGRGERHNFPTIARGDA